MTAPPDGTRAPGAAAPTGITDRCELEQGCLLAGRGQAVGPTTSTVARAVPDTR